MRTPEVLLACCGSLVAFASEAGDAPSLPGLILHLRDPLARPGGYVRARVEWREGLEWGVEGRFATRWQLRNKDGLVISEGGRPVRLPPAGSTSGGRFGIVAGVPPGLRWEALDLQVALLTEEEPDYPQRLLAMGSGSAYVASAHAILDREVFEVTGVLYEVRGWPHVVREGGDPEWSNALDGPGVSEIRLHPYWQGSRATVEAQMFFISELGETGPPTLWVRKVTWLDPLPERLWADEQTRGTIPARVPPPEVLGDLNWRLRVLDSRTPFVIENAEEMAAFQREIRSSDPDGPDFLRSLEYTDFETWRVVVLPAGVCPTPAYRPLVEAALFDTDTRTTTVRYGVFGPKQDRDRGYAWVEPLQVVALLRRPGAVVFERNEWIPDPPPWW